MVFGRKEKVIRASDGKAGVNISKCLTHTARSISGENAPPLHAASSSLEKFRSRGSGRDLRKVNSRRHRPGGVPINDPKARLNAARSENPDRKAISESGRSGSENNDLATSRRCRIK